MHAEGADCRTIFTFLWIERPKSGILGSKGLNYFSHALLAIETKMDHVSNLIFSTSYNGGAPAAVNLSLNMRT